MGVCSNIVHHLVSFATFGLAVAIAVIVAVKFYEVNVYDDGNNPVAVQAQCLLGPDYDSKSLCTYVFIVCGVSVAVSLAISLVQCITCYLCGLGGCLDFLFAIAGAVWWIVASSITTSNIVDANNNNYPLEGWRTNVLILMWVEAACFLFLIIVGIVNLCSRS